MNHFRNEPLFDIGVQTPIKILSINSTSQNQVAALIEYIKDIVGTPHLIMSKPYRILSQRYFMISITGDVSRFNLTLVETGHTHWPNISNKRFRLYMDVIDIIDGFWLVEFLKQEFALTPKNCE